MLKILNRKQTKELDAYTIKHESIASIDLMERACRAFVNWFTGNFDTAKKVGIVCGTGNNGGDGLGIARMLNEVGYSVKVWIVRGSIAESEDFKHQLHLLRGKISIDEILTTSDKGLFTDRNILIDAIFGSGLSRPVEGIYEQAISCMNQSEATRIAVDIPSGLMSDVHSSGVILEAHHTVTFHLPKLAFVLPENYRFTGEWHIVSIGLSRKFIEQSSSSNFLIERSDIVNIKKLRSKFDHKGNYGHALLIAGSYGKMGAAVLGARAAMRSGLGLLSTHVPRCGYSIMQTSIPESMISIDAHENNFTQAPDLEKYNAIGIGPGLGMEKATVEGFISVLEKYSNPMVIDADGLNILSEHRHLLNLIPERSLLTPHPKEFQRLVGTWRTDFERLEKLKAFAHQTKAILILKGANTSIATPAGDVYFNSTGNPGMATGGSGDVLTGVLTALVAQGYSPLEAAILGVYLHGLAGDLAVGRKSEESLIASDVIDFLPEAFKALSV